MLTLANFGELAEPILREVFIAGFQRDAESVPTVLDLFGKMSSQKKYEYALGIGSVGLFDERKEGAGNNYDEMEELFKTTFTNREYQKSLKVDRTMIEDQDYLGVRQIADAMGVNASRTMRQHAANIFNNAFDATNHLGADSQSLCDGAHPYDAGGGVTASNSGTTALSYAAVTATRILMRKFKDARNKPIAVVPDVLVVPVDLEETAYQIAEAINKPGTANNDSNFHRGLRVISDPYLSDDASWWLVDSVLSAQQLLMFDRIPLTYQLESDNAREPNYVQSARMRYSMGWSDWRFVYGHTV